MQPLAVSKVGKPATALFALIRINSNKRKQELPDVGAVSANGGFLPTVNADYAMPAVMIGVGIFHVDF